MDVAFIHTGMKVEWRHYQRLVVSVEMHQLFVYESVYLRCAVYIVRVTEQLRRVSEKK